MGFVDRWNKLVMECVCFVFYTTVINRKQVGSLTPSRGLQQGDPLSPYLFLLCAEGLVSLMKNSMKRGTIQGVAVAKGGLANLFFCR